MWILTAEDAELPLENLGKPMKLQPSPLKMRSPRFHFAPTAKDAVFPMFHLEPLLRLQFPRLPLHVTAKDAVFPVFHLAPLLRVPSRATRHPGKAKDASTLPANDAVPPSTNPGKAKDASTLPANNAVPPSTNPGKAKDASTLPANNAVPPSTNPGKAKDASTLPANDAYLLRGTLEKAKDASTLSANNTVPPSTNPGQAKDASILIRKRLQEFLPEYPEHLPTLHTALLTRAAPTLQDVLTP
ncbi:hypothetical protein EDB89DRAFT_2078674 [Lactarius sanguifluus]|nr:hypothetical protein EDB89DRAFT_2078674 [Lactarius sanguifluus]